VWRTRRPGFGPPPTGYVAQVSDDAEETTGQTSDEGSDRLTGPADPHTAGPDAPTAPGGPQRSDAPVGSTSPGGPEQPNTAPGPDQAEPEVHPSSTPDGPQTIPVPASQREPTADGEIHASSQTELVNEELQEENAETSLDQPSDGSGGE